MRFVPKASPTRILIGEPEDASVDVGKALFEKQQVYARVWSGKSVLAPGDKTETKELVDRVLSPLAKDEVGTIRCIGLNVGLVPL